MIKTENATNHNNWKFEAIYDNEGPEMAPNFLEFQSIFAGHVTKEVELVVPLLDYVVEESYAYMLNMDQLKRIAEEFLAKYKDMEKEHESTRVTAHRMLELSKETGNARGERLWQSVEAHEKLEKSSLKIACQAAEHVLSRRLYFTVGIPTKTVNQ
ncbi:MAG: hypothetical protein M1593_03520 [Candidatus Thermoplasmatota archaeon]|nr:hypothetical protein [Candidatus Thermoplasmatota archaeon]